MVFRSLVYLRELKLRRVVVGTEDAILVYNAERREFMSFEFQFAEYGRGFLTAEHGFWRVKSFLNYYLRIEILLVATLFILVMELRVWMVLIIGLFFLLFFYLCRGGTIFKLLIFPGILLRCYTPPCSNSPHPISTLLSH